MFNAPCPVVSDFLITYKIIQPLLIISFIKTDAGFDI
jgi:hypothetical protein